MSIGFGYYQGNRSEYLAIPALSKLGFTIPVPRQEDHFGIDFIIHLAKLTNSAVRPTGRSFGVQIKSNKDTIEIGKENERDYLYDTTLPFFLGIVSREDLTLKIYSTINRLRFYYLSSPGQEFRFVFEEQGGLRPEDDFEKGVIRVGKPIIEITIADKETPTERTSEMKNLQATMKSWVELENQAITLKEQGIPMVFWPSTYETNVPLGNDLSYTKNADLKTLPDICKATELTLNALLFYAEVLNVPSDGKTTLLELIRNDANIVKKHCRMLREALESNN